MSKKRILIRWFHYLVTYPTLLALALIIVSITILYSIADMGEPELTVNVNDYVVTERNDTLFCNESFLVQDSSQLWELYIKGSGQERGAAQGALTKDLMKYQEDVFIDQIKRIIPSERYLSFLRFFIIIFNRNLGEYIPLENRNEIMAMSQFCTNEYNTIGTPYQRQLNYHGAHDIGHAMQQYMLVGCSAFANWDNDTSLLIGRNFDFYVSEDFAKHKIITFAVPDSGYKYASIAWAGMMGVLSGMNEKGLTVTINAGKGSMPTSAATPISILTRQILQYAANIDEAYAIAQQHQTFVSESILIGSKEDNSAAVIEKTPDQIALYRAPKSPLVVTNHFQSETFAHDNHNVENIKNSDSQYRYNRLSELLQQHDTLRYRDAISVLRNRYGMGGEDVGIGNEMTLNQSIAHHAVLFQPHSATMWVTTNPWQSGTWVAYSLEQFFQTGTPPHQEPALAVPADSLFLQQDYPKLLAYRAGIVEIKEAMKTDTPLENEWIDTFLTYNPHHYYTYRIMGDYYAHLKMGEKASLYYAKALQCEIPYLSERLEMEKLLNEEK